jgi:hypothetical protein
MKLFVLLFAAALLFASVQDGGGFMDRIRDVFSRIAGRGGKSAIEVSTDKGVYEMGERVKVVIKNAGSSDLEGTPSYVIYNSSGKEVFSPMMAQVIKTLRVNESITLTWMQMDNNGKQVKEGKYRIEASFAGLKNSTEFEIKSAYVNIASIIAEPQKYDGKEVVVKGTFVGWSIPQHEIVTPMLTRSDWVVEDESGAIYVANLSAEPLDPAGDSGKKVIVIGTVRVLEGGPYIEGKSIRLA